MIAYIDASVVLRIVLEQPSPLAEWDELEGGVSSPLLAIECHRTLDRFWREDRLDEAAFTAKRIEVDTIMRRLGVIPLRAPVLHAAAQPLPTILGTLDAIHLASAMVYRIVQPKDERPLLFATHDDQLARAARALNFDVLGVGA